MSSSFSSRRRRSSRPAHAPPCTTNTSIIIQPLISIFTYTFIQPFSLISLTVLILLLQTNIQPTLAITHTYLPLSYTIPSGQQECIYERITEPNEHLTSSVFVLGGEELQAAIVYEGPVAPVDLDLGVKTGKSPTGSELQRYLTRYDKEGTKMFVKGKFGDSMLNVKPIRIAELINFEEEEEDYIDDYFLSDRERREYNEHHDMEHQHEPPPPHESPKKKMKKRDLQRDERHMPRRGSKEDSQEEEEEYDDDFVKAREEMRLEHLRKEAELDDDFVKLQMNHERHAKPEMDNEGPRRRRINNNSEDVEERRGRDHRRLREEIKLVAGEPYQKTIKVESPGWYRLCVHPKTSTIEVEMELRKGKDIDPRTGHVPELIGVETHSEIHSLFNKEDDEVILAEEGAIKDEDLRATKEQLRILEKVYSDIISKQLEERRVWNWRTIKNQHLYSHLVLGNLVETLFYMVITGWQVYTIRKWFGGPSVLGR